MGNILYIVLVALVTVLLLREKRAFAGAYDGLTGSQKRVLAAVSVLVLLPAAAFFGYVLFTVAYLNPSGYWYKQAQAATPYHIYRSGMPPSGKVQSSLYMKTSIPGFPDATRIAYDRNPFADAGSDRSSPLILTQAAIPETFDLNGYVNAQYPDFARKTAEVTVAAGGTGFMLERSGTASATLTLRHLVFTTPDKVVILISGLNNPESNLLQLANSLK